MSSAAPSDESSLKIKTLLMSDMVGSTRLIEQLGDVDAASLFRRHDRLARDLLARYGGLEIDKSDGFLLLFDRPLKAVRYALAYHRAVVELSRQENVEVRSRVGIHMGEVILQHNLPQDVARGAKPLEVEGLTKPLAARLMTLAQGGQTLLTRSVYDIAGQALQLADETRDLHWREHGSFRIQGVDELVEVFEIGEKGVSPLVAPPDTEKAHRPHNSEDTVVDGGQSPLRFTRSRLAWMIMTVLLMIAAGSMLWRELHSAAGAAQRPSVSVLGFKSSSGAPDVAWLSTAFSEMLRTELAAGGRLELTSGESVARMKNDLELPETDTLASDTLDKVRQNLGIDYVVLGSFLALNDSGDLAVRLDFRLQDAASGEVVAAGSESGSGADLFSIVTRAGSYLRGEMGIKPPSAAEAGAVRATVSSSSQSTALYAQALDALRGYDPLAALDLLRRSIEDDSEFALAHAATSQAWLKLGYDQKAEASGKRAFELAKEKVLPREQVLSIEGRYHEAAADWGQALAAYRLLWGLYPGTVEYGLRLAEVQQRAGHDTDALVTVARLRQLPEPAGTDVRIDLIEATSAFNLGDYQRALIAAGRAVERADDRKAKTFLAEALQLRGVTSRRLGQSAEAAADFDRSREMFLEIGDRGQAATVMASYSIILRNRGDLADSERLRREALAIFKGTGNRQMVSTVLNNLANIYRLRGELIEAKELLEESLVIVREIGDAWREPTRLNRLGWLALAAGNLEEAEARLRDARTARQAHGSQRGMVLDEHLSGRLAFARGDLESARGHYEQALETSEAIGHQIQTAHVLKDIADLSLVRGDLVTARSTIERAEAIQLRLDLQSYLVDSHLVHSALALESGELAESERLARGAKLEFAREGQGDGEILAASLLAQALMAQDRLAAAREAFAEARILAQSSQQPAVRLTAIITAARLAMASEAESARESLVNAMSEARQLGLVTLELTARLALGELALAVEEGSPGADLLALAQDAQGKGLGLIAGKARVLAATDPRSTDSSTTDRAS